MKLSSVLRLLEFAAVYPKSAAKRLLQPPLSNPDAAVQVLVRYSVLIAGRHWNLARGKSVGEYRSELFDRERLARRLALFRRITLPSLDEQTLPFEKGRRELVLFVSHGLPIEHRQALEDLKSARNWMRLFTLPDTVGRLPALPGPAELFASVRLDDDDALSPRFLERLSGYVRPEYAGFAITFPRGTRAFVDQEGSLTTSRPRYSPGHSAGLAYVVTPQTPFRSIHHLGGHNWVHRKVPVVIDHLPDAYVRTVHADRDSDNRPALTQR